MRRVTERRASTLGVSLLLTVVVMAFPALASAAPGCPSSVAMDNVHSGVTQFASLTCDDPSGTGLTYSVDPANDAQRGSVQFDGGGGVYYFSNPDAKGQDDFTVVVADNEGGTTDVDFSIEVVNQAPVCHDISFDAAPRAEAVAFPDCSDPDGDGFTVHANPAVARHERRLVQHPHLPVERELRGRRQLHVLRQRCRRGRQPRDGIRHGQQRRP